jgi:hypothetical protein
MKMSYKGGRRRSRAITVRVPGARLNKLIRARKFTTQSELINALLAEEEERLEAQAVLRETAGAAGPKDFDARLL